MCASKLKSPSQSQGRKEPQASTYGGRPQSLFRFQAIFKY